MNVGKPRSLGRFLLPTLAHDVEQFRWAVGRTRQGALSIAGGGAVTVVRAGNGRTAGRIERGFGRVVALDDAG